MSKYRISVEGKTYEMDVELIGANGVAIQPVTKPTSTDVATPKVTPAPVTAKPAKVGTSSITAPMPGTILKVLKETGDAVKAGEVILILEAMKMENEITAPTGGTIDSLNLTEGSTVSGGELLFRVK